MREPMAVKRSLWRMLVFLTVLAWVAALAGCREADIEESLGASTAREIESTYGVVENPLVADWATSLGQQVVGVSTRNNIPYEFKVLETDMVNAFAAPYGHVYFTRGILDFVDREDELAFVMSHEVGHVVGRHAMSGIKKQFWVSVLFSLWNTDKYAGLKQASGIFAVFGLLRYSRVQEYEADRYGIQYALANGYDPVAGADFFRRLESEGGRTSGLEVYFMTHPPTDRRVNAVETSEAIAPTNAGAMLAIAEGYARRGQYRRAAGRFQQVVAANGRSVEGHLGLAQALKALGKATDAGQEYEQVLRLDESNRVAKTGLAALQGARSAPVIAAAGAQAIEQARSQASAALAAASSAEAAVREGTAEGAENLTASRDLSRSATANILDLSGISDEAEGIAADLVGEADVALRSANEALYGLDDLDAKALDAAKRLRASAARAESALRTPDGLDAWRVASLREAGMLAERSAQSLQRIPELRPEALNAVRNSQRVASNVVGRVGDAFKDGGDGQVLASIKGMTAQAQAAGAKAKEKVDTLKNQTSRARTDALVAQIDVLGATAPAAMLEACDQMVAYYFAGEADEICAMREDGHTYGQIALSLAAERSIGKHAPGITSGIDALALTDAVERAGVDLADAGVFLKFLANTLEEETAPEG